MTNIATFYNGPVHVKHTYEGSKIHNRVKVKINLTIELCFLRTSEITKCIKVYGDVAI